MKSIYRKDMDNWESIKRDEFDAYEVVRLSGVTNMWDVKRVMELSGLDRDTITIIMRHYSRIKEKYEN